MFVNTSQYNVVQYNIHFKYDLSDKQTIEHSTKTDHYKLCKGRIYGRAVVLNCNRLYRCT